MPAKLTLTKKMKAVAGASRLEMSVTKTGGPVTTRAEVGSTGSDDQKFQDSQLTPGPAVKPLNPNNTYSILWHGAFVLAGSATLRVRVFDAQGNATNKQVTVQGKKGDEFFRVVLIP
jgi:hypothetical protein